MEMVSSSYNQELPNPSWALAIKEVNKGNTNIRLGTSEYTTGVEITEMRSLNCNKTGHYRCHTWGKRRLVTWTDTKGQDINTNTTPASDYTKIGHSDR